MGDVEKRAPAWRALGGAALLLAALSPVGGLRSADGTQGPPPAPPVTGAVVLFDGTDTSAWVTRGSEGPVRWPVADGAMTVSRGNIVTTEKFRDFQLHLEWMAPDMPNARGQSKANSGIGLQGRYEIQLLDSSGWERPGKGDCGAVYDQAAPLVNACKPPLQWQTMDITFRAARFKDGRRIEKARVTVVQNGIVVQNNTEINGPTGIQPRSDDERQPGPILLQDHGNPLRFRNIWIRPLPEKGSDSYEPRKGLAE